MASTGRLAAAQAALSVLQAALAVAIAVVVRQALWTFTGAWRWAPSWWSRTSADNVCLMTPGSANLCALAYVVVAASLLASCIAVLMQCMSRGRRVGRCCAAADLGLAVVLCAAWLAAAAAATIYGMRADAAGMPRGAARTAVWAMAWVLAGLWALSALAAVAARRAARRSVSETELSGAHTRYSRYNDTPFTDRSSKWKEARSAYLSRGAAPPPASPKHVAP
ncbi:hypothetical protein C2E20_8991 [Micractinium conductrix]|uniref:Uncharacterized protein n=1 Tax=Micractinium conductrix TaxID=554055 RepID=A0A2P6UZS4_9CHLO|nr:hypothetical protein C2E20_8991 [Micractinium conductrix]|eukprot:PSC67329.1 hypothetical protein C2E20_8991 [Micractinium conductrix]